MEFNTWRLAYIIHFCPGRVWRNWENRWLLANFLVLSMSTSSTWVNILAHIAGNIPLLTVYMNSSMTYMYNYFEKMMFNAEYDWSVSVRGGTLAHDDVIRCKRFFALLALCEGNPPTTKVSDAKLWCFLWSEQTIEQTIETPMIWGSAAFIMTSL